MSSRWSDYRFKLKAERTNLQSGEGSTSESESEAEEAGEPPCRRRKLDEDVSTQKEDGDEEEEREGKADDNEPQDMDMEEASSVGSEDQKSIAHQDTGSSSLEESTDANGEPEENEEVHTVLNQELHQDALMEEAEPDSQQQHNLNKDVVNPLVELPMIDNNPPLAVHTQVVKDLSIFGLEQGGGVNPAIQGHFENNQARTENEPNIQHLPFNEFQEGSGNSLDEQADSQINPIITAYEPNVQQLPLDELQRVEVNPEAAPGLAPNGQGNQNPAPAELFGIAEADAISTDEDDSGSSSDDDASSSNGSSESSESVSSDSSDSEDGMDPANLHAPRRPANVRYDGNRPLYDGASLTLQDSLIAIMTVVLTHSLTGACLLDLLGLIAIHCPVGSLCVKSLYMFKKYFKHVGKEILVCHYFCSHCFELLARKDINCTKCLDKTEVSYFIEIPIISQLQVMFQRPGFLNDLQFRFTRQKKVPGNIEDIYDGNMYKEHVRMGFLNQPHNISFMWYSDGISVFNFSNKFSIWPFYLVINELSYKNRTKKQNIILAGIWFGKNFLNAFPF